MVWRCVVITALAVGSGRTRKDGLMSFAALNLRAQRRKAIVDARRRFDGNWCTAGVGRRGANARENLRNGE